MSLNEKKKKHIYTMTKTKYITNKFKVIQFPTQNLFFESQNLSKFKFLYC